MNRSLIKALALSYELDADKSKHVVDLIIDAYMAGFFEAEKMYQEVLKSRKELIK